MSDYLGEAVTHMLAAGRLLEQAHDRLCKERAIDPATLASIARGHLDMAELLLTLEARAATTT